eukprot:TRINITY_DN3143_c0_g1_i8.p1 TRINITY_DN3143_c0_g1~~TRINITY_DN3143_c0_g1_i8.p1  ORF type:complete len:304 (-),score=33.40 TRINITY_DN3143_c0_g1_i8:136-1047(-)
MGILFSASPGEEVFIDMENPKPTSSEAATYKQVEDVLRESKDVYQRIEDYKGCQELARKAMKTPNKENETAAFVGLLSCVDSITAFHHQAKSIESALPKLWGALCDTKEGRVTIGDQQALAKQLADIFDFALRFDQTRMMRPNLSNDFSYYRRLLPKFGKHPDIKVKDDEASGMALFTADHIPMMSCIAKATQRFVEEQSAGDAVAQVLGVMANSCQKMIKSRKFTKRDTNLFCARAMTGAIVLYDHVVPDPGVFGKKSFIQVRNHILLLQKEFPKEQSLINAIRYSTKYFASAPPAVQALFD